MKFRSTVATASLSFSVLTNIVFAQNTANNEILIYPPKKPPITKKWYKPLEFGEGRFTTGLYSGLNRFPRRRVNADMLDPFGHRPLPTIKKKSSSFKPGTWNWRPGKKPPAFSYRYRIINLTKDLQGSYEGMPGDYRQNYRPIPHVRFGGTFAPIPPLMGDPTQHRQGWYIKKYRDTLPKRDQYNQYIMDNVNDKIEESYPSLEWVTYSWNNPYNQKYNLSKDKIRPRFGSYEAFSNYDSRFPAYKPKRRYEVIKIPEAPPIYKRSAEKEDPSGKNAKSIDLKSVPSKSEDVIRNLQSASSIMQSALRTARLRQEPESVISSSDYDSNEVLNSENSISLSSVYESSGTNSSSSDSLIDSEAIRKAAPAGPGDNGKKSLLFSAHRKQKQQQNIDVSNMRHVRHKRSPPHKGSVEKLAKKLNLSPKKEESKWTFKNMPSEAPELPNMSIFRLEDQPDSFWDSIYGRTNEKNSSSSSDSDSSSDSELEDATMNPVITTMQMQRVPKVHPGIGLPQDKKKPFLHLKGGINQEPLMETRGKRDRARREKKKKKLTSEEREEKKEKKKRKGRTNFARDYPIEIPREGADLKGMDAFRFPTFPPEFTSFVPPRPYKQPTPYVQPTIPPRPPPRRPYVRIAEVQQSKINNAQHTENNMFHLQNNMYGSPHEAADSDKVRIINGNVERVQSDIVHVQNKAWNKHITGSRVDNTKQKVNVIKDNVDRIQSDMHNIKNSVHNNGKKKEFFASIPHLHGNKGLHGSLGLPDARRRNLERTLRFGDDRLYDSEEISENDKAVWSIGPPLNESEPVLNTEERNYVPEGAYQFPHFRNPNFDPDTAYDENGVPIFMSPNYTEPTTLKDDWYFGPGKAIQQRHGLIGEHHNQIAHDLKAIAGGAKAMKSSPNIGKHIQIPHAKLQTETDHQREQVLHELVDKAVHPGVINQVQNVRKHVVEKRHAMYADYNDDHPYSRYRMGIYMPRPADVRYLRQGLTVPPYKLGKSSLPNISTAPYDDENRIIFKRSLDGSNLDNSSVSGISGTDKYDIGNTTSNMTTTIHGISGTDKYDIGNMTSNMTTTIHERSKRNANPEPKKKKYKKFKKYHKQLKIKDDDDDDKKNNSPQDNLEMLNSITEKLKEQLVSDMNHRKANSDKQKSNFISNSILKNDSDGKINNNTLKAVPPIHLVKKITEEIYNNLDKRYPLHKPALNSHVTVIRARPGKEDQFLPIQHAPIQVRLNKKTGEYQIRYTNKNEDRNGAGSVHFVNGSVHEDKEKRKKLWQQFDEKLRNIRAGIASPITMTSIPVTTASVSHEKRTRKKRRRVVKKIVRVRRRRTTTPEPVSDDVKTIEEISEVSDKQIFVSSESKTKETYEISDIKGKGKKKIKAGTKRQKDGRKRKVTETPVITSTDVYKDKMKPDDSIKTVQNATRIHKMYSEPAVSSSEEEKSTYFTSEKPVHILITHMSPPQPNISTSKIPLSSIIKTSFTVTPKAMLVTTKLPQNHEYRKIMTTSFKADLRKDISYSTYLYSKYHSIATARSQVTTAHFPTTVITEQHSKTAVTLETSDEFLMSSNESTERPTFGATSNTVEPLEFTTPIVPPKISKGITKESEIHRTTKSLESSEDLADRTITGSVKSSEEVLKSTTRESLKPVKDLTTVSWRTSTEESHRSLETLKKTLKDNTTLIASTLSTIIGGIKDFTSEYSIGKPTQDSFVISEQATLITSASTGWPTMREIRTEMTEQPTKSSTESQSAMETIEQTTLLWRQLPTIVFKVYSTLSSTPYARSVKSKHSNLHGKGLYQSGWYRYQSYSSRNLGSRYKPYPPVTSKPYWDKQWNRYNGRYGKNQKHGPPKYTWQRGDYLVPRMAYVDMPESAIPMPITTAVSIEDTSLVEVETSTVKMKLVEDDILPTSYEEQHTTLSFNEEQQTTVVPIIEIGYENLSKEEDHTTLVTDSHSHVSFSSPTLEKTREPSETYIISQTSVKKEDIISSTSYPKFLTTLLPQEQHIHHVPEYTSITTASEIKDITLSMEHKRFKTAGSLLVDKHTVQTPFIKTHLTLLDTLEHTTHHTISEKHTTESLLPTAQQIQRTVEELYTSESSHEVNTITIWTPYTGTPSTQSYTTLPTTVSTTVKEVYTTSEPLPQRPVVPKEVSSYKGPKFEWPIFDIKNILTTVSPLLGILSQSTLPHQIHDNIVTSETPKLEVSTVKHIDSSIMDKLHDTGKSVPTEPTILTEKMYITNQSTISSIETTAISPDNLTVMPTEDENSLLKVVPDTDLVSSEDGVLKKVFVNPFKAIKKYFKDSFESESQEKHYINYDEPNETAEYDFNDIYNEPYFDKNATDAHFTLMRFKGTYVTVRTIYRRPSNFTFPPTPPLTKKPTTQPPVTTIKATRKPEKLGLFGFMKHRAKKAFKNIADFFAPDLSDEEEEIRRMRKNVMVEEEEDEDDEH